MLRVWGVGTLLAFIFQVHASVLLGVFLASALATTGLIQNSAAGWGLEGVTMCASAR